MSKRNSEGDVLTNRLSVALAKHKKLLASWTNYGDEPESNEADKRKEEDDLKDEDEGVENLGVGSKIPKEIQDGSFTRGLNASNNKLLEQLMGKKAAKAHIASKQRPQTAITTKSGKPNRMQKKVESEDEEEGRAAAFKSKRRKKTKIEDDAVSSAAPDRDIEDGPSSIRSDATKTAPPASDDDDNFNSGTSKSKSKPLNYLDELLAERSKKAKKKKNKKNEPQPASSTESREPIVTSHETLGTHEKPKSISQPVPEDVKPKIVEPGPSAHQEPAKDALPSRSKKSRKKDKGMGRIVFD